jgi:hypothetical protein
METILQLLERLDGVKAYGAGTGSIYVYSKGLKVRIADHEPNYNVPGRRNDKCFYTQDACGKKADIYSIVSEVADYLQIEVTGTLKGMITKHYNEQARLAEAAYKAKCEHEEYMKAYNEKRAGEMANLKTIIEENENEIKDIIAKAEEYGRLGKTGDKRRKRTKSFFRRAFAEKFGVEANLSDVGKIMNK